MNNLCRVLMLAAICYGATHAANVPNNDDERRTVFNHLNFVFARSFELFHKECIEFQTEDGVGKPKQLMKVPYCKQLIAMMDEINFKLEREFHGYKRYDIVLDESKNNLVQKYKKAS